MTTGETITKIRESRDILQKELAKAIKVDPVVLNRIEKGKRPVRGDEIKAIARFFNVSTDYLLGNDIKRCQNHLSEEQEKLLSGFGRLNPDGKSLVLNMISQLSGIHDSKSDGGTTMIRKGNYFSNNTFRVTAM